MDKPICPVCKCPIENDDVITLDTGEKAHRLCGKYLTEQDALNEGTDNGLITESTLLM
ncbi:hypothetical protein EniLVp02_0067 [Vibrio phage EniLVp02]